MKTVCAIILIIGIANISHAFLFIPHQRRVLPLYRQQLAGCNYFLNVNDKVISSSTSSLETEKLSTMGTIYEETWNLVPQHFERKNMYSHKTKVPHKHIWERLLPSPLSSSSNGIDISVTFSDDIDTGARELIDKCNIFREEERRSVEHIDIINYLRECMCEFAQFVPNKKYKVRIVSSRGKKGQKCPRWHIDHVNLRLILALHGPGVCYAAPTENHYESFVNACSEIDTKEANKIIEKQFGNNIEYFEAGDYVVLLGKAWENSENGNAAAIHRSPSIMPFQGRVLITIDVVEN